MHKKFDTKKMVGLALFTAIVVVLQFMGSFIRFGMFSVSLVLIPIVVCAAVYGWKSGAVIGAVFAVMVFVTGDANAFLVVNPIGTVITVFVKGIMCGLCAGLVYKLLEKFSSIAAVAASAVVCPVVNTGIFLIGCRLFFYDTVAEWGRGLGFGENTAAYMFLGLAGGNFLFELLFNVILSPVIVRLIKISKIVEKE